MAGNTYKKTQDFIINFVESIIPGGGNKEMYSALFAKMSDKEFKEYMDNVEKRGYLDIIVPNLQKAKLNTSRNIKIAKKFNHNFFERVWVKYRDPNKPSYLSNEKYMIVQFNVRRQSQHSIKGISTSEDNKRLDQLTGQPTSDSKSAKMSFPESQLVAGMDLKASLVELLKTRGGDIGMFNAFKNTLSKTGEVSMAAIADRATGVESTKNLSILLTAAHLKNNLFVG